MTDEKKRKTQENSSKTEDGASGQVDKQELQERILRGIKPNVGEMTGKWVVDLSEGGGGQVSVPTTAFDEQKAEQFPDDMRSWVDRIFDDFQRYIYEYNKAIDLQELLINSERPNFVKDSQSGSLKYRPQQAPQTVIFQGHLYTRHWALLIRGEESNVKAFALPVDFLIAFDSRQEEFKPYFEMRGAKNRKGMTIWHVDAVPISFEALSAISKALFGVLVKASRHELGDQERFKLASAQKEDQETTDTEAFVRRYTIPPGSKNFLFGEAGQGFKPSPAQPLAIAPPTPPLPLPQHSAPAPAVSAALPPSGFGAQPGIGAPAQQSASGYPGQAPTPAQNYQPRPYPPQSAQQYPPPPQQSGPPQVPQPQVPQPQVPLPQAPLPQVPLPQAPLPQAPQPRPYPPQQAQPQYQPQQQQQPQFPPPQPQLQFPAQQAQQQFPPRQAQPQQLPQQFPPQQSQQTPQQPQPGQQPQSATTGLDEITARLEENKTAVIAACQATNQALQAQMDALTKIGVASLHQQSMEGVMQVMKRTNSLKVLRDKLEAVIQEWSMIQSSK